MSEEQRVREGDSVTIECVARGIPAPGVSITRYEQLQVTSAPRTSADDRTYEVSFICYSGSMGCPLLIFARKFHEIFYVSKINSSHSQTTNEFTNSNKIFITSLVKHFRTSSVPNKDKG